MKPIAAVLLSTTVLAGCSGLAVKTALPFLPRVSPPPPGTEQVMLAAAFSGTLVVDRGCVKVKTVGSGVATTVLWYAGAELGRDRRGLFLRQATSGTRVRFGSGARFGGGSASAAHIEQAYPEVAARCGGPYAFGYAGGA